MSIRSLLEALYFLSGIVVAITALLALKQIRLMKLDMLSRSERVAKEKAIEAAFEYAKLCSTFENRASEIHEKLKIRIPEAYEGKIGNFSLESISEKQQIEGKQKLLLFYGQMNLLDAISAS